MSVPFVCVIVASITASVVVAVTAASPRSDAIAAVFPPWWSAAQVARAAAASGDILGFGALRSVVVVKANGPDLAARLRHAGALATLDGRTLAICGTPPIGVHP